MVLFTQQTVGFICYLAISGSELFPDSAAAVIPSQKSIINGRWSVDNSVPVEKLGWHMKSLLMLGEMFRLSMCSVTPGRVIRILHSIALQKIKFK